MKNKVLVAGCGISGIGAARMLLAAGKSVILYDGNDKKNKEEIRAQVADNSSDETLSIVLGTLSQDVIDQSWYSNGSCFCRGVKEKWCADLE